MEPQKLSQPWVDLSRAIDYRDCEANDATQAIHAARCLLGILQIGEHFARPVKEQCAGIRQRDPARGAQ
jgi:hypothetical protein